MSQLILYFVSLLALAVAQAQTINTNDNVKIKDDLSDYDFKTTD
jgi:hypothetical protein